MAAEDVARALELLEDDSVADRVVGGDHSNLPEGLSDAEVALVTAAAADRPAEVTGYGWSSPRALGTADVGGSWKLAVDYAAGTGGLSLPHDPVLPGDQYKPRPPGGF
jgi:hypothetical protein